MKTDIEKIYTEAGVMLTQVGDRWKAPCPFHAEKDPSFMVYPDGGYHCFGCGAHGTLEDIAAYIGIDFVSVPDLAYEQDHVSLETRKYLSKVECAMLDMRDEILQKKDFRVFDKFDDIYFDCLAMSSLLDGSLVRVISYIRKTMGKDLFV